MSAWAGEEYGVGVLCCSEVASRSRRSAGGGHSFLARLAPAPRALGPMSNIERVVDNPSLTNVASQHPPCATPLYITPQPRYAHTMSGQIENLAPSFAPFFGMVSASPDTDDFIS